jgi:hypothetical protein
MKIRAETNSLHAGAARAAGLTFSEQMSGGFSLGETKPQDGARLGNAAGSYLTLRITLVIPDLAGFLSNPEHAGALTGDLKFAPLGESLEIHSGSVHLFRRTDNPALKLMEYFGALRCGTRNYWLAGRKEIWNGHLFRSWSETTTLYCVLHEGPDSQGPIVGAGVLRLTMWNFLKQLATFRAVNAVSAVATAGLLSRFGLFFAKELLDSYA